MTKIRIDDVEYELESLSEEAKKRFQAVQLADQEIQRLQNQMALAQTARIVYVKALKESLQQPIQNETISFAGLR